METNKNVVTEKNPTYYKGRELTLRKLAFGSGEIVYNLPWMLVSAYLSFFLTDIAIIPAAVISALFLGVRVFDAVNDPLIGILSDRTRTKMGQFRPWMLAGAIILLPSVVMLFWAHPEWSESSRTLYATVFYILAVIGATMWNIPYGGLNAALTPYPDERASFSSYRIFISALACASVSVLFLPIVTRVSESSQGNVVLGYVVGALFVCGITIPFIFTSILGTKEVVKPPKQQKMSFSKVIKNIVQNPPLLIVIFGFFMFGFMMYGRMTVAIYYFSYVWGNQGLFVTYSLFNGIASGVVAFFCIHLLKIFKTKRNTILVGYAGLAILSMIVYFLNPSNASPALLMTILIISGGFQGIVAALIYSMIPDTVEYGQWKSGIRVAGVIYSGTTFMLKLGGAIAPSMLLALLTIYGYTPNVAQTDTTLGVINFMMNLVPALLSLLTLVIFLFYKLDNKLHAKIVADLEERGEHLVEQVD